MNKFLLVRMKSAWARTHFFDKLAVSIQLAVPFEAKLTVVQKLSESVALICLQPSDFFEFGRPYAIGPAHTLVFDGWPLRGDAPPLHKAGAADLLAWTTDRSPEDIYRQLSGEYDLSLYTHGTDEMTAFADYSAMKPLFYIDNSDFCAVSNRQMLLNPICTRSDMPEFDMLQSASYLSQANKFGDKSIFRDVKLLKPGERFISRPDRPVEIKRFDEQLWHGREKPAQADYDAAAHSLVSNFNWFNKVPALSNAPITMSLTGGEDSRLSMTIALASSIKDRVEAFTYGYADNPDIKAAAIVARAAGVKHNINITQPQNPGKPNFEDLWWKLRRHAHRFEGSSGTWDGVGTDGARQTNLDLTGLFDFFYKRVRPSDAAIDFSSTEQFRNHLWTVQQPYDDANMVLPVGRAEESAYMDRWVVEKLDAGAELNDLPELYFHENRMMWWAGVMNNNVLNRIRMSPLSSRMAATVGLKQSVEDRRDRRFIFEMTRRLAPHLLEVPYLNKQWPERIVNLAPEVNFPRTQFADESKGTPNASVPWQILMIKNLNRELKDFITGQPNQDVFEVINRQSVIGLLDDPGQIKNMAPIKGLLNLVTLQLLYNNAWDIKKDDIEDHKIDNPGLETNVPSFGEALARTQFVPRILALTRYPEIPSAQPKTNAPGRKQLIIPLPLDRAKALRIDPFSGSGTAVLHGAYIQSRGKTIITLDLKNKLTSNDQARLVKSTTEENVTVVATGEDPQLFFEDLNLTAYRQLPEVSLSVDITVPVNAVLEVFFNYGAGWTREGMFSRHM